VCVCVCVFLVDRSDDHLNNYSNWTFLVKKFETEFHESSKISFLAFFVDQSNAREIPNFAAAAAAAVRIRFYYYKVL